MTIFSVMFSAFIGALLGAWAKDLAVAVRRALVAPKSWLLLIKIKLDCAKNGFATYSPTEPEVEHFYTTQCWLEIDGYKVNTSSAMPGNLTSPLGTSVIRYLPNK